MLRDARSRVWRCLCMRALLRSTRQRTATTMAVKQMIIGRSYNMKRLILLVMVLCGLALSSCEKEPKHESYYVLYFSAHVVDEDGNPIQGICAYPETSAFYGRTGYSDYKGVISGFVHIHPSVLHNIIFEDVDGEYNGGEYETITVSIREKLSGLENKPDDWGFVGSGIVDLGDVVMKLK